MTSIRLLLVLLSACTASSLPPGFSPDASVDARVGVDAGDAEVAPCESGWRDGPPSCDIDLNLGYLPAWGELPHDTLIDERVSTLCDVESCGCANDLSTPRAEFDCFCAAAAECRPAHLRTASGAAVGPCWTDYLVIPTDEGCVFEQSRGCELTGAPTVQRYRAIDCSEESRRGFGAFADPLSDPIHENRFWADPEVVEEGTATILRWSIDESAAYCLVDDASSEFWLDGGRLVTPDASRDYVLDCPGGPSPVVGLRASVTVVEATARRSFDVRRIVRDGVYDGAEFTWNVVGVDSCTLHVAGEATPVGATGRFESPLAFGVLDCGEGEGRVTLTTEPGR